MQKRSGFQSSIQEFLTKSNDEVLGELTKFQEGSVEIWTIKFIRCISIKNSWNIC